MMLDDPTGNDYEPKCFAISVHMRNFYLAYNLQEVDANILTNECITENIKL